MDIFIDNNALDFSLEAEDTIHEVVTGIENWLSSHGKMMAQITINGQSYLPHQRQTWPNLGIPDIKTLEIQSCSSIDYAAQTLISVKEYIETYIHILQSKDQEVTHHKNQKIEGLQWITEAILGCCKVLVVDPSSLFHKTSSLNEVISFMNISIVELESHKMDDAYFRELFQVHLIPKLELLLLFLPKIGHSASFAYAMNHNQEITKEHFSIQLNEHIEVLHNFAEVLPEIGVHIQTGNDLEAISTIKKVICVMENLVLFLHQIEKHYGLNFKEIQIDSQTIADINEEFHELIQQLYESFKSNDMVLLSDLLEYELTQRFELYQSILTKLLKEKELIHAH